MQTEGKAVCNTEEIKRRLYEFEARIYRQTLTALFILAVLLVGVYIALT